MHFFYLESVHCCFDTSDNFRHLSNICSVLIVQKNCLGQITFLCPGSLGPRRCRDDRPGLKSASTLERQRGGWRCTASCALLYSAFNNRDKRVRNRVYIGYALMLQIWPGLMFGLQKSRTGQCDGEWRRRSESALWASINAFAA